MFNREAYERFLAEGMRGIQSREEGIQSREEKKILEQQVRANARAAAFWMIAFFAATVVAVLK